MLVDKSSMLTSIIAGANKIDRKGGIMRDQVGKEGLTKDNTPVGILIQDDCRLCVKY